MVFFVICHIILRFRANYRWFFVIRSLADSLDRIGSIVFLSNDSQVLPHISAINDLDLVT